MPIRIYEIAKKLGIENKVVLAKAKELGFKAAKIPSSSLDKITAEYLEIQLGGALAAAPSRGLCSVGLANFKAFAEAQTIPLRPLTLIFGANSSGKSSLIHGLLLAQHALGTGELDVTRTEMGGDSVDLGGFRQYVHRRDVSKRVQWFFKLRPAVLGDRVFRTLHQPKDATLSLTIGMPLDNLGQAASGATPELMSYELEANGKSLVRLSRRPDQTMQLDRVDKEMLQPVVDAMLLSHTTTNIVDVASKEAFVQVLEELLPALRFTLGKFLPERAGAEIQEREMMMVPVDKGNRLETLKGAARVFIPRIIGDLVRSLNAALQTELGRLRYLGPLRSFPVRHLAFAEDKDRNWFAGGGYAWDVVRTNAEVRNAVNRWLGSDAMQTRYELRIRSLAAFDALADPLAEALEHTAVDVVEAGYHGGRDSDGREHDGEPPRYGVKDPEGESERLIEFLANTVGEKFNELVLMDLRTKTAVTHRDVGVGVSQVLPVLVHAYADKNQLVAIEQPEIHLHPALQADLGDVFIESALGEQKNTFLLETHSEHLILRILRRVRETTDGRLPPAGIPVRPEDLSVVFVEPASKGSVVRHLPVTPDGDFAVPWPGGFFADRLKDLP